jgi:hypothetical protein
MARDAGKNGGETVFSAVFYQGQDIACERDALVLVCHQRIEPHGVAHRNIIPDILHEDIRDPAVTIEGPDRARFVSGSLHKSAGRPADGSMADERAHGDNELVPQCGFQPVLIRDRISRANAMLLSSSVISVSNLTEWLTATSSRIS